MTTDNSTAEGYANDRTKIKRSKAMDMRFYWIKDRVNQGEFIVHWSKSEGNLADYFTKHHPPSHHIRMRPTYLHAAHAALDTEPDCKGVLIRDFQSRIRETTQDSEPPEIERGGGSPRYAFTQLHSNADPGLPVHSQRTSVTPAITRLRNCLDMGLTDPQDDATEWTVVVRRSKWHSCQAGTTGAQAQPFAASEIHSSSVD